MGGTVRALVTGQVRDDDWDNYVLLLRELRAALDAASPSKHMELTIAMGMNPRVSGAAPRAELGALLDAVRRPLHLARISSRAHLARISHTSRAHLARISRTSGAHLARRRST